MTITPELVKLYRNRGRQHRYEIKQCIIGVGQSSGRLCVWVKAIEHDYTHIKRSINKVNPEINCFISDSGSRLIVCDGDVILFHDKSLDHYNRLSQYGNMIFEME
jgi:hypothetical protein